MSTAAVVIIGLLVLVIVALLIALDRAQERATDERLETARKTREERRELLTRITHPQLVPVPKAPRTDDEPKRTDELHKVGTIALARDAASDPDADGAA